MIDFLKIFFPQEFNRELLLFLLTILFIIPTVYTSFEDSHRIASTPKDDISTFEKFIPNLESVCVDNELMQCLSFEEPHDSMVKIYTNKFLEKKTYTLQIVPNTRN